MTIGFVAPKALLDRKPRHGEACNRCGLCCMASLCPLALDVFGGPEAGPCPALSFDENGSICGLVAEPENFAPDVTDRHGIEPTRTAAVHLIGSGLGCDCRVNGEPGDEAFYRRLADHDHRTKRRTRVALNIWKL